jgi:hypothetical protein
MCVCSLIYSACNAHAQYYIVIYGVSMCTILFQYYLIDGTIFWKRLLKIRVCVSISSTNIFLHISNSKKTSATCYHKCTKLFIYSACYCWQILIKIEFSRQLYIFMKIPLWGTSCSMRTYRQTNGHTDVYTDRNGEAINRFRNFANAPKTATPCESYIHAG